MINEIKKILFEYRYILSIIIGAAFLLGVLIGVFIGYNSN